MKKTALIIIAISILALFLSGCTSSKEVQVNETAAVAAPCVTKECFITKADSCEDANITVVEDFGTVNYLSSGCVFTKTLVSAGNETAEIKKLIEGKSMTCKYEKGKFDQRLVNTVVFGIEYCEGELKDRIVDMLAFL